MTASQSHVKMEAPASTKLIHSSAFACPVMGETHVRKVRVRILNTHTDEKETTAHKGVIHFEFCVRMCGTDYSSTSPCALVRKPSHLVLVANSFLQNHTGGNNPNQAAFLLQLYVITQCHKDVSLCSYQRVYLCVSRDWRLTDADRSSRRRNKIRIAFHASVSNARFPVLWTCTFPSCLCGGWIQHMVRFYVWLDSVVIAVICSTLYTVCSGVQSLLSVCLLLHCQALFFFLLLPTVDVWNSNKLRKLVTGMCNAGLYVHV